MSGTVNPPRHWIISALLAISDAVAAVLLAADLLVVCVSVLLRFLLNAPVEWSDDVARGLMVGSSFFGAASAIARSENPGVSFFVDLLPRTASGSSHAGASAMASGLRSTGNRQ